MKSPLALLFALGLLQTTHAQRDTLPDQLIRQVVVTGQFAPTDARAAVTPVRVLSRERIERMGANNLEQLLRQELNLRIGQDMVLGSSLAVQGLSGQNVKILVDGVPVVGRTNGNIDLGQINLANIERVEIIEGPASVFYGTDALAGVVNLISRRGQAEKFKIGLTSQYEQLGERSLQANAGLNIGQRWLLQASGGYDQFVGFDTSATERDQLWNPKRQHYAEAMLRYMFAGDHFLRLKTAIFNETVENLGEIRRPQFKPYAFDESYLTLRRDFALLHEGTIFNKFYWNNALGLNLFRREKEALRTELETNAQAPIAGEQDTSRITSAMFRSVIASKNPAQRWQWLAGVDTRFDRAFGQRIRDSLSNTPGESTLADLAFIGSLRWLPTDRTTVESGLRAAWNSRYRGAIVPSLNIRHRISQDIDLRASVARGFRSPDLKELFLYFIDASHYVIGNANLRPERSDNVQINLSWEKPAHRLAPRVQVNGFWNHIRDKIELYEFVETPGGMEPVTGDTSTFRYSYFNIEEYKTYGTVVRSSVGWRSFRLDVGGSITGYYNPYHAELAETPQFTYTHELNTALQWRRNSWNAGLWLRSHDRFVRYFPETENGQPVVQQRIIGGYTDVDFSAGKSFWKKRLCLQAGVRNLLNVQSAAVGTTTGGGHGTDSAQTISPGRSVWARAQFNI